MITDKDREWTLCFIETLKANGVNMSDFTLEIIDELMKEHRAESAEQARKEAAEMLCRSCPGCDYYNGGDISDNCALRNAILGDSVVKENLITDHIPDAEKLAIAVKALEYVVSKSLPSDVFGGHYSRLQDACAKASDALKEIQG